eukprot:96706-Amphidinium_carterae.2
MVWSCVSAQLKSCQWARKTTSFAHVMLISKAEQEEKEGGAPICKRIARKALVGTSPCRLSEVTTTLRLRCCSCTFSTGRLPISVTLLHCLCVPLSWSQLVHQQPRRWRWHIAKTVKYGRLAKQSHDIARETCFPLDTLECTMSRRRAVQNE